ncbi:MAG TPA: hypothetical protein VD735_06480, partial [Candidatus Saccharimonadales bacterium]|nr:hypothetical protein [Candidatus Saccharimonadales bacterium]
MPTPGEQARIPLTWQSERLGRPYDTQPRLDAGAIIGALGLDVSITQLGEAFTIDESLTDALRPAQSHVHRIGLPETDADIAAASERGKIRTIEDYGKSHRQLDTGRVLRLPDGLSRMAASERRTLMRRAESIARVQTENTIRERAREMRRSTELGLRRSTALTPLTSALRMAYGKELDSTPLERVEGMPEADMLLVVSPDELAAGVSEKLFRGRMRERGIVDLSKEALDARSDNLLKVLQIELGSLFLHDTVQLGTLGRAREDRALGLFRRYKDVLGEDDLDLKVEAYDRLAEGASKFSSASDQPGIGEFASLLATRAYNTLSDVHMLKYELGVIYDGLGYPVPAVLRDDKPSIHDMAPQLQPSTQAEAPPVPETDPAATAEAQRLADTLGEPVQAFNDLWRLSAKSRTKRELDTVVQALCKGTVDATGNQALTAMERGYAREVTDILARLHEYSSGKRSIADRLTEADATQQTLTEQLRFVRQFAIDNHVRSGDVQYPVLLQLHSH